MRELVGRVQLAEHTRHRDDRIVDALRVAQSNGEELLADEEHLLELSGR